MFSSTGPDASNFVSTYNVAFYSIAGVSLVLLVGLTMLMLYFIFRYNRKKNIEAVQIEGNTKLEIHSSDTGISDVLFWLVRV
jgi:cytochrome c oxidase subunit 2